MREVRKEDAVSGGWCLRERIERAARAAFTRARAAGRAAGCASLLCAAALALGACDGGPGPGSSGPALAPTAAALPAAAAGAAGEPAVAGTPPIDAASGGAAPAGAFDGERAFADLRDQVAIGPRPTGSPGSAATRELITTRMRAAGWRVEEQRATVTSPVSGQPVELVNLIATLPGAQEASLLLGAHYDTKRFDQRFVGANDGASGVAVLLELARWLGRGPQPALTLRMLFFDAEESFGPSITETDGLYGSRAVAEKFAEDGELARARALILVDMVGDRDLNLGVDLNSAANLRELQLKHGAGITDLQQTFNLIDDHIPFLQRGFRQVLALIDFQYGARESPGPLWHTPADDLAAVSAQSLSQVGNLVIRIVQELGAVPAPAAADGARPAARNAAPAARNAAMGAARSAG